MEELNGVTLYWLISLGLLIGYVVGLIMSSRGVSLAGNLIGGVFSSLFIGVGAVLLNLFGALMYAAIGSIAFLFLVNIFFIEPIHENDTTVTR